MKPQKAPPARILRALLAGIACVLVACRPSPEHGPGAPLAPERAIVILVSIDGFRWDYLDRHEAPNLARLAAEGVRSEGLIPQFPSKTFPNHYTIVTGLRLANHGIISNNMRAADIPGEFSLSNRDVLADSRWWGGEPIWNTVEKQGRVAAAMFWPGSETVIGGRQATFWKPFDDDLPHPERVAQILAWLKLPEGQRPSFLTMYFSEVDDAGHDAGPESDAVGDAVGNVDRSLGELVTGVNSLGLDDRVHYVVVSDHGMAALSPDRMIVVDHYVDVAAMDVVDWAPVIALSPKDGNVEKLYAALKDKHPHLAVYRKNDIPPEYGISGHPRLPAVIGIADEGWYITSQREVDRWGQSDRRPPGGTHGYDARVRSMHGVFIAAGPRIKSDLVVKPFENIHVYEFICAVMGVTPAKNDGDPSVTRDMLR
jgi:predicted AlkP superfamily pyrophosphatase or phosphodiesterase